MPESQPSALVFATATPSATVSIVSPTSVPASASPAAPGIAFSPDAIVAPLPPIPVFAPVMPAAPTPIVSPAPSAAAATTVPPTPSATATTVPPISITNPMPVQIAPAHISDASPAAQKHYVEKVKVLHVKATGVEELASIAVTNTDNQSTQSASACKPAY